MLHQQTAFLVYRIYPRLMGFTYNTTCCFYCSCCFAVSILFVCFLNSFFCRCSIFCFSLFFIAVSYPHMCLDPHLFPHETVFMLEESKVGKERTTSDSECWLCFRFVVVVLFCFLLARRFRDLCLWSLL